MKRSMLLKEAEPELKNGKASEHSLNKKGRAMKTSRLAVALTLVNLIILLYALSQSQAHANQTVRASAIELIDAKGQVRAQFNIEAGGEVVFRMRDASGNIRVKLGASEDGAGFLLLDNKTEPRVHLLAKSNGTSFTLTDQNGAQHVIKP